MTDAATPGNATTTSMTAPPADGGAGQTQTADGTGPNAGTQATTTAPDDRRYTQEDIDRVVSERLNRQKAQLARDAEEARLKAQQEWQQLAQKHETRVKELEPQVEQLAEALKARDALLMETVKSEIKEWPPEARALIPTQADALAQMEAAAKARPLVAKLAEAGQQQQQQTGAPYSGRPPGNTPGPRPAGEPNKTLVERELERLRATGVYGNRGSR